MSEKGSTVLFLVQLTEYIAKVTLVFQRVYIAFSFSSAHSTVLFASAVADVDRPALSGASSALTGLKLIFFPASDCHAASHYAHAHRIFFCAC